jgi:hypothetical protein
MTDWQRFWYGLLGSLSPEIIRWWRIAMHPQASNLPSSWPVYLMAGTLFTLFGGLFATMWQDDSRIKCYYFGVSFPVFVSAFLSTQPKLPGL